jgi:maltose O-acetyltransferase
MAPACELGRDTGGRLVNSLLLFLANLLSRLTPQTRWFGLRRRLFTLAGVAVAPTAQLNGRVTVQNRNVRIGHRTWVGTRTEFAATSGAGVTIGSDCDISQDVLFICGSHEVGPAGRRAGAGKSLPISVGNGTWVGARVTFTGGSSVGTGCVVGAGALVRGVFGDNEVIYGVPARSHRTLPA